MSKCLVSNNHTSVHLSLFYWNSNSCSNRKQYYTHVCRIAQWNGNGSKNIHTLLCPLYDFSPGTENVWKLWYITGEDVRWFHLFSKKQFIYVCEKLLIYLMCWNPNLDNYKKKSN